jgi:hypothetical protein
MARASEKQVGLQIDPQVRQWLCRQADTGIPLLGQTLDKGQVRQTLTRHHIRYGIWPANCVYFVYSFNPHTFNQGRYRLCFNRGSTDRLVLAPR